MFIKLLLFTFLTAFVSCGPRTHLQTGVASIINGKSIAPSDYPWLVLITSEDENEMCSGVIVEKSFILTAAHCVDSLKEVMVFQGNGDRLSDRAFIGVSEKVFIHPNFSWKRDLNDIALVKLKAPLRFNKVTTSIEFIKEEEILKNKNLNFVTMGWGRTEENEVSSVLKMIRLKSMPFFSDAEFWVSYRGIDFYNKYIDYVTNSLIATAPIVSGQGICSGDSGGPLVAYDDENKSYLLGVAAFIDGPCGAGLNLFTSVPFFYEWIMSIVSSNLE